MFAEPTTSTLTLLGGAAGILALTACVFFSPSRLLRWLQKKRYQYEVTFSLYMMTPTEKFIFNSILFLFLSMVTIAASLYLPEHISFICRRAFYYLGGDAHHSPDLGASSGLAASSSVVASATAVVASAVGSVSRSGGSVVGEVVEGVRETVSGVGAV